MGYVEDLRALVGHRPLILVGASVVLPDHAGRVLLVHRGDNQQWGLVGGYLELGESVEAAARREVREEVDLESGELTFFGLYSGPEFFYVYPNGDQVWGVAVAYVAHHWTGRPRPDGTETRACEFFDPRQPPQPLTKGAQRILADYTR